MSDTPITDAVLNCETRCDLHYLSPNFVTTPAMYMAQLTEEATELRETCQKLERMCEQLASSVGNACQAAAIYGDEPPKMYFSALAKYQEMKDAAK